MARRDGPDLGSARRAENQRTEWRDAQANRVGAAVERRGLTMVFCEHDMETVFTHARRVVVMDRGTLIADGTPEAVKVDELVQEVYLGRRPGRQA